MRPIALISLILLLSACAAPIKKDTSSFSELVQGTWAEYIEDGEIKVYVTYLPDGRFHTFGYYPPDFSKYFFADGFWRIEDDQSCIYISYISAGSHSAGDVLCNRIVSLNERSFVFDSGGRDIKMLKISETEL